MMWFVNPSDVDLMFFGLLIALIFIVLLPKGGDSDGG